MLLVLPAHLPRQGDMAAARLNPVFRIEGVALVLHPLEPVFVAAEHLGQQ